MGKLKAVREQLGQKAEQKGSHVSRFHMGLNHLSPQPPPLFPTVTGNTPSSIGLGLAGLPPLPEFVEDKVNLKRPQKTQYACAANTQVRHTFSPHTHSLHTHNQSHCYNLPHVPSYFPSSLSSDNTICYVKCNMPMGCLAPIPWHLFHTSHVTTRRALSNLLREGESRENQRKQRVEVKVGD